MAYASHPPTLKLSSNERSVTGRGAIKLTNQHIWMIELILQMTQQPPSSAALQELKSFRSSECKVSFASSQISDWPHTDTTAATTIQRLVRPVTRSRVAV